MATQGPNQKDAKKDAKPSKPKKEYTEEEKRTRFLLGVMGVLAFITSAIYVPPLIFHPAAPTNSAAPVAAPTSAIPMPGTASKGAAPGAPPSPGAPPAPGAAPGATPPAGGPGSVTAGGATAGGAASATPVAPGAPPVIQYRQDPFVEFTLKSDAEPTPTPRPQIILPPPGGDLAPVAVSDDEKNRRYAIAGLPQPYIPRLSSVDRSAAVPVPPRAGAAGSQDVQPSYNKRLSGVIIGDGVRALLEINDGQEIVTRVVQPGDEVDGIQVLSIGQVSEGNKTVTRMIISENGAQESVDLKPAPVQPTTAAGGPGGAPAAAPAG